ncbi:MAG TPA: 50S ribosomal protein L18 [Planctomycetota bacterium]|nr:50S ribosomal protein L18 [Planctomycetota bacterium]
MERAFRLRILRRKRKAGSVRRRVRGTAVRPRLTVHRSSKQIYVQAIDDLTGVTLAASSTLDPTLSEKLEGTKTAAAKLVGEDIARRLLEKGVKAAVFDRGWYPYHGRIKALADGARSGGLDF